MNGVGLDEYTRNARLKPALAAVMPLALTVAVWSSGSGFGWGGLWALIVACGGTMLVSQLARDWGKSKEKGLFDRFGGRPTERLLSHESAPNKVRLATHHARLRKLMPKTPIPSADDERRDPSAANETYAACTKLLISRSRENRMVFQENMNYGFRRNLWGMKPIGILISVGAVASLAARMYRDPTFVSPETVGVLGVSIVMLGLWLFWITPRWVMVQANAYAERLMDTLDA